MEKEKHKENCMKHVVKRFEERFVEEDFIYESRKMGVVDFKNEVVDAIINAPKAGKFVKGGKGYRAIFKVRVMDTKPVFVVWDMFLNCAVTVLTGEMWNESYKDT